jgi:hypothetical protein
MSSDSKRSSLFWTNLIVMVLFGILLASVIFAWTNPGSNPPGGSGAISASGGNIGISQGTPTADLHVGADLIYAHVSNGQVGIKTTSPTVGSALSVNGFLSMMSNVIKDVDTPVDNNDAANKAYVDAAGSDANAGGITTVTLFGTAATEVFGIDLFRGPNSAVPPGCHNNPIGCSFIIANLWGAGVMNYSIQPPAGQGTPLCTSLTLPPGASGTWQWFEIYAGYGPHETVVNNYAIQGLFPMEASPGNSFTWQVDPDLTSGYGDIQNSDIALSAVSVSDSVCGPEISNVNVVNTISGNQISVSAGMNSACSAYGCNTCRICGLVRTAAP